MNLLRRPLTAFSLLALLLVSPAVGQSGEQRITASDAAPDSRFGSGLAVDGDTAFVGASKHSAAALWAGAVYVEARTAGVWAEIQKLAPMELAVGDGFGAAIALQGDFAAVGASGDDEGGFDAGAVYLYERVQGVWSLTQKLMASDASDFDTFGASVSLDGDRLAVGATTHTAPGFDRQGAVYLFERGPAGWQESARLFATQPASLEGFGHALVLEGDQLLVGAPRNDDRCPFPADCNTGAVHVFEQSAQGWVGTATLYASDVLPSTTFFDHRFGWSVAASGTLALVGAYGDDELAMDAGAVYAFERGAGGWAATQKITSPSPTPLQDRFGQAVGLRGARGIVGAPFDDAGATPAGAAFLLERSLAGLWFVAEEVRPSDGAVFDGFGGAVGVLDDALLVGAQFHDPGPGLWTGAAYAYGGESVGVRYCVPAVPNSTGLPGIIVAVGSAAAAGGNVTLTADHLPMQFGYFLVSRIQGLFSPPGSNGNLCLGGDIGRYNTAANIIQGPIGSIQVDLAAVPVNPPVAVVPGDTWNFQCWYRDVAGGNNFTDAVSVTFF